MTWHYEDGGPRRTQTISGALGLRPGDALEVTTRIAPAVTMAVAGRAGELFLLRHTAGDDAISFVERIDPETLEPIERSPDLAAGPVWPGGLGVADDGSIHVVFGNHAHHLDPDLAIIASRELPRDQAVQQLRAAPRRSSGHQGLRRITTRPGGSPRRSPAVRAADPRAGAAGDRRPPRPPGAVHRPPVGRRLGHLRRRRHQPPARAMGQRPHPRPRLHRALPDPRRPDLRLGLRHRRRGRVVPRRRGRERAASTARCAATAPRPRPSTSCGST